MSKFDIEFDPSDLPLGLYEIFWRDDNGGGSSLASVGNDRSGKKWMAPSNWVSGPSFDWSHVSSVRRIEDQLYSSAVTITRNEEDGRSVSYSVSPNAAYNTQIIGAAVERILEAAS